MKKNQYLLISITLNNNNNKFNRFRNEIINCAFLTVFILDKSNAENPAWEAYKIRYGCVFDSVAEDQKREAIWEQNLNELVSNQKKFAADGKLPSFRLGINKFSMYTYDEKVEKFTGLLERPESAEEECWTRMRLKYTKEM